MLRPKEKAAAAGSRRAWALTSSSSSNVQQVPEPSPWPDVDFNDTRTQYYTLLRTYPYHLSCHTIPPSTAMPVVSSRGDQIVR